MLRTFSGSDLLKIGKRLDRAANERTAEAARPTVGQRMDAVPRRNLRLRQLLRRRSSS